MKKIIFFIFWLDLFSGMILSGEPNLSISALSPKSVLNFSKPESSTTETYIRSFKNVETTDSTSHDFMYYWVKSKTDSGEWPKDIIVINFDFHPDDENGNPGLDVGNWGGHLKKEGLISEYWWLYPSDTSVTFNTKSTSDIDVQSRSLYALQPTEKPVVITIDIDYLLSYTLQSSALDMPFIERQIEQMTMALQANEYKVLGVNFTHSPDYLSVESSFKDEVFRRLGEEFEKLFGDVVFGTRVASLSYNETPLSFSKDSSPSAKDRNLTVHFEYNGEKIIGILNKKSNLNNEQRKDALTYFNRLSPSAIKSIGISG